MEMFTAETSKMDKGMVKVYANLATVHFTEVIGVTMLLTDMALSFQVIMR